MHNAGTRRRSGRKPSSTEGEEKPTNTAGEDKTSRYLIGAKQIHHQSQAARQAARRQLNQANASSSEPNHTPPSGPRSTNQPCVRAHISRKSRRRSAASKHEQQTQLKAQISRKEGHTSAAIQRTEQPRVKTPISRGSTHKSATREDTHQPLFKAQISRE